MSRHSSTSSVSSVKSTDNSIDDSKGTLSGFASVQKLFNKKENHNNMQGLEDLEKQLVDNIHDLAEDRLKNPKLSKSDRRLFSSQLVTLQKQKAIIDAEKVMLANKKHFYAASALYNSNRDAREVFGIEGGNQIKQWEALQKEHQKNIDAAYKDLHLSKPTSKAMQKLAESTKQANQCQSTLGQYTETVSKNIMQQAIGAAENFVKVNPLRSAEHKAPLERFESASKALSLAQELPNAPVQSLSQTKRLLDTAREDIEKSAKETSEKYHSIKAPGVAGANIRSTEEEIRQQATSRLADTSHEKPPTRPEKSHYAQHIQSQIRAEQNLQEAAKMSDSMWNDIRKVEQSISKIPTSKERDSMQQSIEIQKLKMMMIDNVIESTAQDFVKPARPEKSAKTQEMQQNIVKESKKPNSKIILSKVDAMVQNFSHTEIPSTSTLRTSKKVGPDVPGH